MDSTNETVNSVLLSSLSKSNEFRFLESVHEIELIIVKLINESLTKAITIEQMIDILEIFANFQSRTVGILDEIFIDI